MENRNIDDIINEDMVIISISDIQNGNPNGDPNNNNRPRKNNHNKGIMTPGSQTRDLRDALENMGENIFFKKGRPLNDKIKEESKKIIREDTKDNAIPKELRQKQSEFHNSLCKDYIDLRLFGGVISTGVNSDGEPIHGTLSTRYALENDITANYNNDKEILITRNYATDGGDEKNKTMGVQHILSYGVYEHMITVSKNRAKKTGVTYRDIKMLINAMVEQYNNDASATKGLRAVRHLFLIVKRNKETENTNIINRQDAAIKDCFVVEQHPDVVGQVKSHKDWTVVVDVEMLKNMEVDCYFLYPTMSKSSNGGTEAQILPKLEGLEDFFNRLMVGEE